MKKKLLFILSLVSITKMTNAQNNYFEPFSPGTKQEKLTVNKPVKNKSTTVDEDFSYYYWENNSRHTAELNALLGTTGEIDGGFDTLGLYTYNVKEKTANGGYWQKAVQGIPTKDSLTLLGIDFIGVSLNPTSANVTVNVYKKDLSTLLASKVLNVNTTYGFKTLTFDTPISHNDTMLVVFQMTSVADSFAIAKSHSQWTNFNFGPAGVYTSNLPFKGDAAILAVSIANNDAILGLIQADFDFFVVPSFSYKLKSDFNVSDSEICLGDSISFTNNANTHLVKNPILNVIEWDYLANGEEPAYTNYNFGNGSPVLYSDLQGSGVNYATAGSFNVTASTMILPWTASELVNNSQNFNITVTDCSAGILDLENKFVSIYPNPTNDFVRISGFGILEVKVSDTKGSYIESRKVINNETVEIDLKNYKTGVYFLTIQTETDSRIYKVLKN